VCSICRDPRRDATTICVVEQASDIGAIERAGEFRGLYHVLGGRLSPRLLNLALARLAVDRGDPGRDNLWGAGVLRVLPV